MENETDVLESNVDIQDSETVETPVQVDPVDSENDSFPVMEVDASTDEIELLMQLVDNTFFIYQTLIVIAVILILSIFIRRS